MKAFYSSVFELLTSVLASSSSSHSDDKRLGALVESSLVAISTCWVQITDFVVLDILNAGDEAAGAALKSQEEEETDDGTSSRSSSIIASSTTSSFERCSLYENALAFYSTYLGQLDRLCRHGSSVRMRILYDNIAYLFDADADDASTTTTTTQKRRCSTPLGEALCLALVKHFDKYFLFNAQPSRKPLVSNMLRSLLAVSERAKQAALDAGLVEALIEHIKYTSSKLNLKTLKGSSSKGGAATSTSLAKDTAVFVNDLQQSLLILKYLMCNNTNIKETVCRANLVAVVHSLWCWALQDARLLVASLSTLCTLTANNRLAMTLMAQTNAMGSLLAQAQSSNPAISSSSSSSSSNSCSASGASSQLATSSLSLLHAVIKTLQKALMNNNNNNTNSQQQLVQRHAFAVLANCAQSSECKNVIWKSGFLLDFTAIDFHHHHHQAGSSKSNAAAATAVSGSFARERLWLTFLLSLSFSHDGQTMFLKVDSLLATVIYLLNCFAWMQRNSNNNNNNNSKSLTANQQQQLQQQQQQDVPYLALLILRNLTFSARNKSKLVTQADYVSALTKALRFDSVHMQLVALSAIDSLVCDFHKAKAILKSANVLRHLVELGELHHDLKLKGKDTPASLRILATINRLIQILND